jgi:hypothetical protein
LWTASEYTLSLTTQRDGREKNPNYLYSLKNLKAANHRFNAEDVWCSVKGSMTFTIEFFKI